MPFVFYSFKKKNNTRIRKQTTKKWSKTLTNISPKKIDRWKISIWKNAPHRKSSGKCKLKQQWDSTTYLLEWPDSGTLTTSDAGENVDQWELLFIVDKNAK